MNCKKKNIKKNIRANFNYLFIQKSTAQLYYPKYLRSNFRLWKQI